MIRRETLYKDIMEAALLSYYLDNLHSNTRMISRWLHRMTDTCWKLCKLGVRATDAVIENWGVETGFVQIWCKHRRASSLNGGGRDHISPFHFTVVENWWIGVGRYYLRAHMFIYVDSLTVICAVQWFLNANHLSGFMICHY